jgi:glycosyltransferase involved in cell wall biosynthesis
MMAQRAGRGADREGEPVTGSSSLGELGSALHVVASDQRRGAEVFAQDLADELRRRGMATSVVALEARATAEPMPVPALGRRALTPTTLRALRRAAGPCAAAIAHGSRTLPACAAALAGGGVPFAYRSIGDPRAWAHRGRRRWQTTRLLRRPRLVVALWPAAADALMTIHGLPAARIRVIPNGVAAARCALPDDGARRAARQGFGLPADEPVVCYLGALSTEKDVGRAIAAVAAVPGLRLLVAGEGPARAELQAEAAREAPGRVVFAGVVASAASALAAADAIVLPSRTEGMPGVLIEAGLCAVPAVATDVGGVAEIVADGETGVLVSPGDAAALAAGLRRVLADPRPMGAAARERCLAQFEIGVVGAVWAELLRELVEGR